MEGGVSIKEVSIELSIKGVSIEGGVSIVFHGFCGNNVIYSTHKSFICNVCFCLNFLFNIKSQPGAAESTAYKKSM